MRTEKTNRESRQKGFSLIEVIMVVLIVAILGTILLLGIVRARSAFRFSNAVGTLQINLEKAISDAKRRNAKGDARATIQVLNTNSYETKIDINGDGVPETQTVTLPQQVSFLYDGTPPKVTIDWRGYISEGTVSFFIRSESGDLSEVKLTSRGDAAADADSPTMPTVTVTPISTDVKSSTVLVGNASPNPNVSPTPTPTPMPFCAAAQIPANNNCRCPVGKIIDAKSGKCK